MSARRDEAARLRRLVDVLPQLGEDGQRHAAALRTYLDNAGAGMTLDTAVGVAPGRGGKTWWRADALACRDDALRELAARFHADLSTFQQAATIQQQIRRYASTAWRQDQNRVEMPPEYAGHPKALLYTAFKSAPMSLGIRRLHDVLQGKTSVD